MHRPAILALEDGRVFNGRAAGAITRRGGEVVFNTSLTGYQEVFTDPSYAGQIVCLTYPHIGNVGANLDDEEAAKPYIESLIVREFSQIASSWRSTETAHLYLNRHKIPVIWDIDTRALVRHIRKVGALARHGFDRWYRRRSTDPRSEKPADHGWAGIGEPRELRTIL